MSKKNYTTEHDVQKAWKNYVVGNFYAARKLAREVLASKDSIIASKEQAGSILTMTSADRLALGAGFLVLLFSIIIAYVVAY